MKKIVILGAGESGTGAALLAHAKGYQVLVSDKGVIPERYQQQLMEYGIEFEQGQHTWDKIKAADEIIKSPGVPNEAPIIQAIKESSIPIIDEIEFASRYTDAILIGITGSNGKSTTTHLTYHLLKSAGLNVGIAGNMGQSFAKKVWQEEHDYYVLELSSFQLEYVYKLKLHIGCILNITPDHLDRYQHQMELYVAAKYRILQNMDADDYFIYNPDNYNTQQYLNKLNKLIPKTCPITLTSTLGKLGACVQKNELHFIGESHNFKLPIQELPLPGKHNVYNSMVAITIASLLGIPPTSILIGLKTFKGLPHRMEWIAKIKEVDFYNDSKATNVESAEVALESFTKPIIWIAGGYDKGNHYNILKNVVKKQVKALICLGKDNRPIREAFQDLNLPIYETQRVQEAVELAITIAKPNEIVLLSPACASFDLFKNFEDRGTQFKNAVHQLLANIQDKHDNHQQMD